MIKYETRMHTTLHRAFKHAFKNYTTREAEAIPRNVKISRSNGIWYTVIIRKWDI